MAGAQRCAVAVTVAVTVTAGTMTKRMQALEKAMTTAHAAHAPGRHWYVDALSHKFQVFQVFLFGFSEPD
jgi:hypothetical protein